MSIIYNLLLFACLGVIAPGNQQKDKDGSEPIANAYAAIFNKIVKEKNFTKVELQFDDKFTFKSCIDRFPPLNKTTFMQLVYKVKDNVSMEIDNSKYSMIDKSEITAFVSMHYSNRTNPVKFQLDERSDGSWRWVSAECYRLVTEPDNESSEEQSVLQGWKKDGSESIVKSTILLLNKLIKNNSDNLPLQFDYDFTFDNGTAHSHLDYPKTVFFMILLRERKTFSVKFERSKHLGKNLIGTYVSFDLFGERIFAKFSIYKRWSLFTGVKGIFRHLQWLARKPLAAPRQSSTAPNGTEISESNDDLDESAHIAKFYVELFDKLIKANDITELSFYFSDRFSFLSCWSDYYYNRDELLMIMQFLGTNMPLKFMSSTFNSPSIIEIKIGMNTWRLGDNDAAKFLLQMHPDGSWQFVYGWCNHW